jgi:hypothetical protein
MIILCNRPNSECFRNKLIFYGEELLAPRPAPKLEDHPLPAVRDCLFSIFAASLLNVHRVSDVRQTEIHTAEQLLPDPSPFEVEVAIAK